MYQDNKPKEDMVSVELGNDMKVKAIKGVCTVKTFKDQIKLLKELGIDYVGK